LVDSSDDELFMSEEPPRMDMDDEQEDFDDLLKATKPPEDHFSNPLVRGADNLGKRRKYFGNADQDDSSSVDLSVADISGSQLSLNTNFALLQGRLTESPTSRSPYEDNL
jgi:hypothetical protein